jgi:hypothetical protein
MTGATTKVIYARVPAKLHDAVAAYADQEGLTLTVTGTGGVPWSALEWTRFAKSGSQDYGGRGRWWWDDGRWVITSHDGGKTWAKSSSESFCITFW